MNLRRSIFAANIVGRIKDRISWLSVIGTLAYGLGLLARWRYVLELHHPRNHVYTDAKQLAELAEVLRDPAGHQQFFHTIWPPGMSAFLALNSIFDPTTGTAAVCQLVASALVPLLTARAAHIAYGSRAGFIALTMASLHAGFIHYAGFFLSEQMCQLSVAVAVWTTVAALAFGEASGRDEPSSAKRLLFCRIATGIASGLAWGLAFSLRPNALPVALLAAAWLAFRWLRRRRWSACVTLAAGALAFFLVLAPLSHRCTSLVGNFCPGSSNGMMNVALGHAPDVAGLHFRPVSSDRQGGLDYWFPPAREAHGFRGTGEVDASIFDNGLLLRWVGKQLVNDPTQFAIDSAGNVFDLFGSSYWPDDYGPLNRRTATVMKQGFFLFVLVPGLFAFVDVVRRLRRRRASDVETFFVACICGVILVAAATMGEARYRIPFDTIFIILAARLFTIRREKPAVPHEATLVRGSSATTAVVLAMAAILVVATAHPRTALAARLAPIVQTHRSSPEIAGTRSLAELASPLEDGTAWDAGSTFHRFPCKPDCPELRVDLQGTLHSESIEVSADRNDRYEAAFYKEGRYVGRVAWGPFEWGKDGLRTVRSAVPKEASREGYDTIAVRPLYGDNKYSVGHVRVLQGSSAL